MTSTNTTDALTLREIATLEKYAKEKRKQGTPAGEGAES